MPSERFRILKRSVSELRRHLIPKKIDPTGTYCWIDKVEVRAEAYRVLVHAEIEAYLEDRAIEIARAAWSSWKASRYVTTVTLHLIGFSGRQMDDPVKTLVAPDKNKEKSWPERKYIDDRLGKSVTGYIRFLQKENHGIREANLLSILVPIGVLLDDLDENLVLGLEELGLLRGRVAHTSIELRAADGVDPKAELDRVNDLLDKLLNLDDMLCDLHLQAAIALEPDAP
jgi:hypothetical protein